MGGQRAADDYVTIRRRVLEIEKEQTWRTPAPIGEAPIERDPLPRYCEWCDADANHLERCSGHCCG